MVTRVTISEKNLNTERRREKAKKAATALQKIVNHPKFKELILAMPNSHRRTESSKYKNIPNGQVYKMIMHGAEEWNEEVDYEIDLIVDDYRSSWFTRNVVGYIIPMKPTIWVNTRKFDSDYFTIKDVTSNFLHEYSHTLGFRHSSPDRNGSISYYMNKVVNEIYPLIYSSEDQDDVQHNGYWLCPKYRWLPWNWFKKCKWVAV